MCSATRARWARRAGASAGDGPRAWADRRYRDRLAGLARPSSSAWTSIPARPSDRTAARVPWCSG
ncbi:hypothetical protein DZF91_18400 [Actinomadura logoneensis]|uniref:Uncharacterized protein n=1 Tax=Actinomadura logoneensis TaxID=2293572 RepID=A0A372JJK1_9ACTN|nr:hypothetical protein DZF91_18400 [Actinomadura logoneensis]